MGFKTSSNKPIARSAPTHHHHQQQLSSSCASFSESRKTYSADEVELFIPIMNMGFKTSSKFIARSAKDNDIKIRRQQLSSCVTFSESRKTYSAHEVKL